MTRPVCGLHSASGCGQPRQSSAASTSKQASTHPPACLAPRPPVHPLTRRGGEADEPPISHSIQRGTHKVSRRPEAVGVDEVKVAALQAAARQQAARGRTRLGDWGDGGADPTGGQQGVNKGWARTTHGCHHQLSPPNPIKGCQYWCLPTSQSTSIYLLILSPCSTCKPTWPPPHASTHSAAAPARLPSATAGHCRRQG